MGIAGSEAGDRKIIQAYIMTPMDHVTTHAVPSSLIRDLRCAVLAL
jgi:hypothetical protein